MGIVADMRLQNDENMYIGKNKRAINQRKAAFLVRNKIHGMKCFSKRINNKCNMNVVLFLSAVS